MSTIVTERIENHIGEGVDVGNLMRVPTAMADFNGSILVVAENIATGVAGDTGTYNFTFSEPMDHVNYIVNCTCYNSVPNAGAMVNVFERTVNGFSIHLVNNVGDSVLRGSLITVFGGRD